MVPAELVGTVTHAMPADARAAIAASRSTAGSGTEADASARVSLMNGATHSGTWRIASARISALLSP